MTEQNHTPTDPRDPGPLPPDDLDALLRVWHDLSTERAASARQRILDAVANEPPSSVADSPIPEPQPSPERPSPQATPGEDANRRRWRMIRSLVMNRYAPIAAAAAILLALVIPVLVPTQQTAARADDTIMVPEGGRLDALDAEGNVMGPCPLKHTDVDVEISGHFTRVTVTQSYHNPYDEKIEAVYTFPLSHRSAVDRMVMTIGQRVIVGEIHEREMARAIYEAARERGYVASLLEQERPNIFTQSVANIEPGAEVDIEISYVELLESKDGTYTFDFPMVVGPRYVPGSMPTSSGVVPQDLNGRQGVVLLGPARLTLGEEGDVSELGTLQSGKLTALLNAAVPIARPPADRWAKRSPAKEAAPDDPPATQPADSAEADEPAEAPTQPTLWYAFDATYCSGAKELGVLFTDGTGQVNGRWFYTDPAVIKDMGPGFAPDTDQVPDASRITPMPTRPGTRAGHDISIEVAIDTGGPGIIELTSDLHEIVRADEATRDDGLPRRARVALKDEVEIPNRDFVLSWRQTADTIEEATFTHTGELGNFFTLILQPPKRVDDAEAVARELIFVLDTSGSMRGFPIDKAKEVMSKAIDALRPQDTFNLITFAGDTHILWDKPRPFTEQNRKTAQDFLASRQGRGGTEMMKAINAALVQTVDGAPVPLTLTELANLPADGRKVTVRCSLPVGDIDPEVRDPSDTATQPLSRHLAEYTAQGRVRGALRPVIEGRWVTENTQRVLIIDRLANDKQDDLGGPVRICCFMTDGYVGNDMAIIDAVKQNAHTTRVFSFGIGNSVNRYLLDGMARAGRGEVEYVLLESDADAAAERFAKRIHTPVLTDIELEFSKGLKITDQVPRQVPDLFDAKPMVIHGQYTQPGKGTLTVRGNTGSGRYERTIELELPESRPEHDAIATLWARARVRQLMEEDLTGIQHKQYSPELQQEIIRVGERFGIMTQFTSFVAVEKARVTIGGKPRLVAVPIEMPQGVSWEGVFGCRGAAELMAKDDENGLLGCLTAATPTEHTISVENAPAERVAANLRELVRNGLDGDVIEVKATDDNHLILRANPEDAKLLEQIITKLDARPEGEAVADASGKNQVLRRTVPLAQQPDPRVALAPRKAPAPQGRTAGALTLGYVPVQKDGANKQQQRARYGAFSWYDGDPAARARGRAGRYQASGTVVGLGTGYAQYGSARFGGAAMMGGMGGMGGGGYGGYGGGLGGFVPTHGTGSVNGQVMPPSAFICPSTPAPVMLKEAATKRRLVEAANQGHFRVQRHTEAGQGVLDAPQTDLFAGVLYSGIVASGDAAVTDVPFIRERTVLAIARLVHDGKLADARKLADALVAFDGKYEPGVKARDALADASLGADARDRLMAELVVSPQQVIDDAIRQAKLQERLDPRLYTLATDANAKPDELGLALTDAGVRVALVASELDDATLAALKRAGLSIEATTPVLKLAVGTAPRDRLAEVALVDAVRKIEPTKID